MHVLMFSVNCTINKNIAITTRVVKSGFHTTHICVPILSCFLAKNVVLYVEITNNIEDIMEMSWKSGKSWKYHGN